MGIFKNKIKINKSQKYLDNADAHFLNWNYGRTGCADVQTDQQHSTSHVLICWLMVAWAARCCGMLHSWFNFQIFTRVSNWIFLKFLVRVSSCSSFKLFEFQVVRESNRSTIEGPL